MDLKSIVTYRETYMEILQSKKAYFIASKIYSSVKDFFVFENEQARDQFDSNYENYLDALHENITRKDFYLATIKLLGTLNDSHTSLQDDIFSETYNRLPFCISYIDRKWIVIKPDSEFLAIGDLLLEVDDQPVDTWFDNIKAYISASSEKNKYSLAFYLNYLLSDVDKFTFSDAHGSLKKISLKNQTVNAQDIQSEKIVFDERAKILYIKISMFNDEALEGSILDSIEQYPSESLIIDVRGNSGGSTPVTLMDYFLDSHYDSFAFKTPFAIGLSKAYYNMSQFVEKNDPDSKYKDLLNGSSLFGGLCHLYHCPERVKTAKGLYKGKIVILADEMTASAAEDFVFPFKQTGRATILGNTTFGSTGQPALIELGEGMVLWVSTKRTFFPDGSRFEGVGIAPDIYISNSVDDIRAGTDKVLLKAREILTQP